MTFEEWTGGASEQEVRELTKKTQKRFFFWLLISIIPVLGQFTIGFAIFCYNNLSYIKTRGHSQGNVLVRWIMLLWGFIIIPILEVKLCTKWSGFANKILGWS